MAQDKSADCQVQSAPTKNMVALSSRVWEFLDNRAQIFFHFSGILMRSTGWLLRSILREDRGVRFSREQQDAPGATMVAESNVHLATPFAAKEIQ